ncbi:hypothetical protein [Fodinibius sp. SL11]|uniref:hypothetical protein n=1 Tax=Fodinibius sp. SL11 TaxID=3425690 RepID=UPI003F885DC5
MSYEDLEEHNIFLPEEHWDELDLSSSVNQPLLLGTIIIGLVSCALMVIGAGETITWIGGVLFFVFLYSFTWVSNAGIENQNAIVDDVMKKDT